MILLTILLTFLTIILYLLSNDSDIVRLVITRLEEKLTNIESKSLRVLIRFSILSFEINNKFFIFLSLAFPLEQRPHRIKTTETDHAEYDDLPTDQPQIGSTKPSIESEDLLIQCINENLGFSKGQPLAACIIFKCLRQWDFYEDEKTSIFDRIIQTMYQAIETQDDNDVLAYWLTNASTLMVLWQSTLKASGDAEAPQHMTQQGFRGNISSDSLQKVEAKHPAFLFKQKLTAYVAKIYGMIHANLKKEISPLLGLCIQAPSKSKENLLNGLPGASQDIRIAHWQGIVNNFRSFLNIFKNNNVTPLLVRKIFSQIFYFINVRLFNSILLTRECCCMSNAEYFKTGLFELELWCYEATAEYAGSAWDDLKHTRQAIGFFLIDQKPKKTLDEIRFDLCPVLSIEQLFRISNMYWDDKNDTLGLSPDVISNMRVLMDEDFSSVTCSLCLNHDSKFNA